MEIAKSSLIFYRAPGPYNRSVLFGGSNPILQRSDERLRTIPFSTRRATYTEVQRVQSVLSAAQIYGNLEDAIKLLDKHRVLNQNSKRSKIRCTQINRAKSREIIERPLPTRHSSEIHSLENTQSSESEEGGNNNIQLNTLDNEISFEHLQVFEETEKTKGKTGKKKKTKKSKSKKLQEQELKRKNDLLEILYKGNILKLKEEVAKIGSNIEDNELEGQKELRNTFFNEILDDDGNSLLHIAAMNEHGELIEFLLDNGSDPCLKNKKLQTPYSSTSSKEVREVMKKFARENPQKYNYNKAQIPINTLNPDELAEKKKIQKKFKREKEKVKKEENKIKQKELNEKERFLNLSDREKVTLVVLFVKFKH
ncbi:hypothetical protein WA026_000070 [Henosepilachna vigintioctopunctata]|uniref:VLRF1 domain-containing protein n=1 Tax=Henosepilachna vigintioctopunctata TaxID=420089 RepID=A0AAW1UZ87_9CUCU